MLRCKRNDRERDYDNETIKHGKDKNEMIDFKKTNKDKWRNNKRWMKWYWLMKEVIKNDEWSNVKLWMKL